MTDHETAWELLPWYINGTLEVAERRLVERHLASCAECRAEAELCRGLVEAGGHPEDLAPTPHPAQLDRLVARIVAQGDVPEPSRPGRPPRWLPGRAIASSVRSAGRLAAAALLVLAAGATGYLLAPRSGPSPDEPPPAEYRTLSRSEAPLRRPAGVRPAGTTLRVVFAPETPEREIRRILLDVGAVVVGGPSPLGVYTLRLDAEPDEEEPVAVVLGHMRREPRVLFVEAIDGGGDPAEPPP